MSKERKKRKKRKIEKGKNNNSPLSASIGLTSKFKGADECKPAQ